MRILLLLPLLLLTLSRSAVGQRCKCLEDDRLTEQQKIFRSYRHALVFTGRVVRVDTLRAGDTLHARSRFSGADTVYTRHYGTVRYTFAVARQLKSPAAGQTVQVSANPDTDCGMRFRPGDDYLVFAHRLDHEYAYGDFKPFRLPPYFETSRCNRTKALRDTPPAELEQLTGLARRARLAGAGRPAATPAGRRR